MKQTDIDFISDTIEETRSRIGEFLYDLKQDHETERDQWEHELSEMADRVCAAENSLREVLDRLDDWHRGLCDRDEVVTGPMIRELVRDRFDNRSLTHRFDNRSLTQQVRDWAPEATS